MALKKLSEVFAPFREALRPHPRLYIAGATGEPLDLAVRFAHDPDLARDVMFCGIWVPGINATDWTRFHNSARGETIFLPPALHKSYDAGHTQLFPMAYSQAWPWLSARPFDGAVVLVSPPDSKNEVSLGLSVDFSDAILNRADIPVLGLVHPEMPAPPSSPRYPVSRFSMLAEAEMPLLTLAPSSLSSVYGQIAKHIAALIKPGDTLQFGLGNMQQAILNEIADTKGLKIHSGMISTPVLDLLNADRGLTITTGIAAGTDEFYRAIASDPRITFAPVTHTHSVVRMAAIPNFVAINSIIEIDLYGNANAEFLNGRQISGAGGLPDFLRGAALSQGGRGIVAFASTASAGKISRIVPQLTPGTTTLGRSEIDYVITEHGAARIRGLDLDARAEALIGIADPSHRDALAKAWDEMRR